MGERECVKILTVAERWWKTTQKPGLTVYAGLSSHINVPLPVIAGVAQPEWGRRAHDPPATNC